MTTSPFATRGVIEGFYGRPWTHEQRLALIDFLGARGMNTFVYGPKDDPLVRRDWRQSYDGTALARLRELVDRCSAARMTFAWCIDRFAHVQRDRDVSLATLLARFAELRADGLRQLRAVVTDADLDRRGRHPELGEVTLGELIATWAVHDLDHVAQVYAAVAATQDAAVGPWRAYLRILLRRTD